MRIKLNSILVDNQEEALSFYTEKLGFVKKTDIPMGEFRWLTVVAPDEPDGAELVLEPNAFPAAATFKKALYEAGIPQTALASTDVRAEYEKLVGKGVKFRSEPADAGGTVIAMFDDTCGNLIQMYQLQD
ncbi:MAG: VOC family protein [Gammaproteobacteria bacterium]|nr:VOC family protein [Gammaproteobacteria bacterium]